MNLLATGCDNTNITWYEVVDNSGSERRLYLDSDEVIFSEGHPWKHLIKKAAELAEYTMDVGSNFQCRHNKNESWIDCTVAVAFHPDWEYRLKPRTIKIGNREINSPEREPLKEGQLYYRPAIGEPGNRYYTAIWDDHISDTMALGMGLVFINSEDAIAATEAMLELLRGDK